MTDRLPDVVAAVRLLGPRELVLDGEVIGIGDDERPQRVPGHHEPVRRAALDEHGIPLTALFFDCLRVDGDDLIDPPALGADRRARRRSPARGASPGAGPPTWPRPSVCWRRRSRTGHEGVMVKALDSIYDAGRRGAAWRKVKPVHTLDLVVLAVEWGSGRRQGWLSNLHLGARARADGGFVMVGKTFKGMTDELLTWQTEQLQAIATGSEGHVVHVRPELVVEIALDGVQASRRYPGGVALRFARVRRYRTDKSPAEADTIESVRALLAGPS